MKTVTLFLAELQEGELHFQAEELLNAGWFSEEEALQRLTYERDRKVFRELMGLE